MATMTAREFNQNPSAAKRAARVDPVFITDRGEASYVLISIEEYKRITDQEPSLAEVLTAPLSDVEIDPDWEPEPLKLGLRIPDFSRDTDL
jgi:prevent-host-death family protein